MVCLGLGGRRKHTLQDNPILQARILTVEGSNCTLGVNYTFDEVRPSLGWRRGRRISTLKNDIITMPHRLRNQYRNSRQPCVRPSSASQARRSILQKMGR
jgi:hypothetical protein